MDTAPARRQVCAWGAAFVAAIVYALACPPHGLSYGAWLVPGLLFGATTRMRPGAAIGAGIAFALIFGFGMTNWAVGASLEYFNFNRPLAWTFACGVWLTCGFPYILLAAAYSLLRTHLRGSQLYLGAAILWVVAEILRTTLFSGMPWELLGHTQFRHLWIIQIADLGGVYAVSFIMAWVSISCTASLVDFPVSGRVSQRVRHLAAPLTALAATLVYGGYHERFLPQDESPANAESRRTVAIVQGNIANEFRWKRSHFERSLAQYTQLSRVPTEVDLIVWPENAVDFYVEREPRLRLSLAAVAARSKEGLLYGAPRVGSGNTVHNSAQLIDASGTLIDVYDKRHLVPFAEYDPFDNGDTSLGTDAVYVAGQQADPIRSQFSVIGTLICYEVLFPRLARELVREGAQLLVNLSNDSWMDRGDGVAPSQHFSMAVFRAVETRRYLVRAAASGISGFVDPTGRTYSTLGRGEAAATLDSVYLRNDQTAYVRWGESGLMGITLAYFVVLTIYNRIGPAL